MKSAPVLFSSASDEWRTPTTFFHELSEEFRFDLDAAARRDNRLCYEYLGPDHEDPLRRDALLVPWHRYGQRIFCNPPYSRGRDFIAQAARARAAGVLSVLLVPARTDTRWWHDWVWDQTTHQPRSGREIRFIKGRLKFEAVGTVNSAPFPSAVIVFHPDEDLA